MIIACQIAGQAARADGLSPVLILEVDVKETRSFNYYPAASALLATFMLYHGIEREKNKQR